MTSNSTIIELNEVEKYLAKSFSKSSLRSAKSGLDVVRF